MVLDNFVVFEGVDGSGTSTQIQELRTKLTQHPDISVWFTWEPTDTPIGLLLRQALRGEIKLVPETLAYLFAADRNEHLYTTNGILNHLNRGELVVCDRYILSSLVYQGIGASEELPFAVNSRFPLPALLFLFDLPAEDAEIRYKTRKTRDIYEKLDFQKLVRSRYTTLSESFCKKGSRLVSLDATKSIADIADEVWREIQKLPIFQR